jgi:hypothetical protein
MKDGLISASDKKNSNMKKSLFNILVLFSTIALFSCESKDGDWEKMKWNPQVEKSINVPESGETYTFKSINYNSFWIDAIVENGKNINIESGLHTFTGEWFTINIKENTMIINVSTNNTVANRTLEIEVTAGDIFDSFSFKQKHFDD